MTDSDQLWAFTRKVLIVAAIAILVFIVWHTANAFLLAFGGLLIALVLGKLSGLLTRVTRVPRGASVALVLLVLILAILGLGYLAGSQMAEQMGQVTQNLQQALGNLPSGIRDAFEGATSWMGRAAGWATSGVHFLAYGIVVFFAAIYFAVAPDSYRRGMLAVVPIRHRDRAREVFDATGDALWKWLIGTGISMAVVGVVVAVGLLVLGVPGAIVLGVIAGLFEFIPIAGPWLSAVPAVLVGFASGGYTDALYVAILFVVVQQVESNLITPIAQRKTVSLPPALTILAVVAFAALFGPLGLVFATPLMVAVLVLINLLYIRDVLGDQPRFPG